MQFESRAAKRAWQTNIKLANELVPTMRLFCGLPTAGVIEGTVPLPKGVMENIRPTFLPEKRGAKVTPRKPKPPKPPKPPKARGKKSPIDRDWLVSLWLEGVAIIEIAAELGVSPVRTSSAISKLIREGVVEPRAGAARYNPKAKPLSEDDYPKIVELYHLGMTEPNIMRKLKTSEHQLSMALRVLTEQGLIQPMSSSLRKMVRENGLDEFTSMYNSGLSSTIILKHFNMSYSRYARTINELVSLGRLKRRTKWQRQKENHENRND